MNTEFLFPLATVVSKHKRRSHGILGDCIELTIFYIFELTIMHYMHANWSYSRPYSLFVA